MATGDDIDSARARLANFLRGSHPSISFDDLEPTEVRGYWRRKTLCGGRRGGCREPIHACLFNDGPMRHTIQFFDAGRRGRTRTWEVLRAVTSPAPAPPGAGAGGEG